MSEILLRPDEANAEGTHVMTTADDIQQIVDQLQVRIGGLESSFKGQTQVEFQARLDELARTEAQVMDALRGLGNFLIAAANSMADLDATMAGQLRAI